MKLDRSNGGVELVSRHVLSFLFVAVALSAQTPTGNPLGAAFQYQPLTDASGECKGCHPRQYFEMKQAVHFGYRNISPLFNGLEIASNFFTGGLVSPVYGDSTKTLPDGSPLNTNLFTTPLFTNVLQAFAGYCYTCHQALIERKGEDPTQRSVPEIATGSAFRPDLIRPLRDYNIEDANGNQVLPLTPGGPVPTDAATCGGVEGGCGGDPLSTTGITCDSCHDTAGPDLNRSFQHDGFANMSMLLNNTVEKVGQFADAVQVSESFHVASTDQNKINFLNNSAFCNSCHDVRIPRALPGDLQHQEADINPGGGGVSYFRLENLSTEWQTSPFSGTNNPFGKVTICHDCHTSLFPFNANTTYQVGDMTVTVAAPGIFPMNYAAVPQVPFTCQNTQGQFLGVLCQPPSIGTAGSFDNIALNTDISYATQNQFPLQIRQVSSHYFTGVDIPLTSWVDLVNRIGGDYPDPITGSTPVNPDGTPAGTTGSPLGGAGVPDPGGIICTLDNPCLNEYGQPRSLQLRRQALLENAVRMNVQKTDTSATPGGTFTVRAECVALTGHRYPAGLSQERTTYIQLNVTDDNGFVLYQSGYVVDKPHPETGENAPDGNMDDEDLEHVHIVVDPGRHTAVYQPGPATNGHTNQVIEEGPDNGPEERLYFGTDEGLVLFRNELQKIFLPGEAIGRTDVNGNPIIAQTSHLEETISADLNNTVDNYRSLEPLYPRTFRYNITLPTQQELAEMGVTLKGPIHVHAQINYEHFPPLFARFIARTTGAEGPAGHDLNLVNEQLIDSYLRNIKNVTSDDFTVQLQQ
jgi:hypothetical protein